MTSGPATCASSPARSSRTSCSGDEINRAPPKTQAALLEAMQERQVTSEDGTRRAGAPVPGARDAEPDRVRGDLSAAGGAAGPLPAADRRRVPGSRRPSSSCSRGGWSAARTTSSWTRSSIATSCWRCSERSSRCTRTRASSATRSTSSPPPARARRCRWEPALAARSRCSSCRGPGRRSRVATS